MAIASCDVQELRASGNYSYNQQSGLKEIKPKEPESTSDVQSKAEGSKANKKDKKKKIKKVKKTREEKRLSKERREEEANARKIEIEVSGYTVWGVLLYFYIN